MWALSRRVAGLRFDFDPDGRGERRMRRVRYVMLLGIAAVMWTALTYFAYEQEDLQFACKAITITARSDDASFDWVRQYSGTYTLDRKINGRTAYVKEQGGGTLAYCDEHSIWTLSWIETDPCYCFDVSSERTATYNVEEINELRFWTGEKPDVDIRCNDCNPNRGKQDCSWGGECNESTRSCDCYEGSFGDRCQFIGPCTEVWMEEGFDGTGRGSFSNSFDLLYYEEKALMVNSRPVYGQKLSTPGLLAVIWFDGGRWLVTLSDDFDYSDSHGDAETSLVKYLAEEFDLGNSNWDWTYISEPSNFGNPANVVFRAMLTNPHSWNVNTVTKLGDKEFKLICADCENEDGFLNRDSLILDEDYYCLNTYAWTNTTMCVPEASERHGRIKRCKCDPGFDGPLCHTRPIEGSVSLYLDHGTGVCSVCGKGNVWGVRVLDGISNTCLPFPKEPLLFFSEGTVVSRQLGIHLNSTHFSVFVSGNGATGDENLCKAEEGADEIQSIQRSTSRIGIDYAVYLNKTKSFLGEVVDPAEIDCMNQDDIDQSICDANLQQNVYKYSLEHAWIKLEMKVTQVTTKSP